MEKRAIITIAGAIGSGKSSTAKAIASKLGYQHFSSGDLFRAIAKERDISVEEMNRQAEKEAEIDHAVDERLQQLYANETDLIIDSRLAYHWMPNSFKVYLSLDPQVAATRIYNHIQREGRVSQTAESVAQVLEKTLSRQEGERARYQSLYGVDVTDRTPFNLVIDTSVHGLDEVVHTVIDSYRAWQETA
ncbi:MAG TPA: cytidylate kinase family protein [Candidatus Paceibacterota bacterium]